MNYTISSDSLAVAISSLGGELQSIKDGEGTEFLWQGDVNSWKSRATNLFPHVGRLTEGKYTFEGQTYEMVPHGFAKLMEMEVCEQETSKISFVLKDSPETLKQYPFSFIYTITYELLGNSIGITYNVENKDGKKMFFGIGGHPGFNVPLENGLTFEDYYLEFSNKCRPDQINLSDTCYVDAGTKAFKLADECRIPLKHKLFDRDAIVLENMDKEITIKSENGKKGVKVSYPQMKFLGLWHTPKKEVAFVCIEPWCSLPARQDVVEDLKTAPHLISLNPGEVYENNWSISIVNFK